jgi:hypothetical protein
MTIGPLDETMPFLQNASRTKVRHDDHGVAGPAR